jgi:Nif-specific regulatory protein
MLRRHSILRLPPKGATRAREPHRSTRWFISFAQANRGFSITEARNVIRTQRKSGPGVRGENAGPIERADALQNAPQPPLSSRELVRPPIEPTTISGFGRSGGFFPVVPPIHSDAAIEGGTHQSALWQMRFDALQSPVIPDFGRAGESPHVRGGQEGATFWEPLWGTRARAFPTYLIIAERSSPSRVRFAAPNNGAPLTDSGPFRTTLLRRGKGSNWKAGDQSPPSPPNWYPFSPPPTTPLSQQRSPLIYCVVSRDSSMNATLFAITGPLKGAIFRLGDEEVSIGRQASNQLCIGDLSVSRRHSVIKPEKAGFQILDVGSNNGTYVNGKPVEQATLAHGDTIGIGDTIFEFLLTTGGDLDPQIVIPAEGNDLTAQPTIHVSRTVPRGNPTASQGFNLMAFEKISKILSSELTLESLCPHLFDALADMMPVKRGAILLVGYGTGNAASTLCWDGQSCQSAAVRIERSIVNQVINSAEAVLTHGLALESPGRVGTPAGTTASILAVPLLVQGKVRSVVYLDAGDSGAQFGEEHLQLLQPLSGYVAITVENLRERERVDRSVPPGPPSAGIKHEMLGESPRMRELYQRIGRIAPTEATVLIRGETGTGKEVVAQAIHHNSSRAGRPFQAINCALLKDNLLESELFGHEKGAFTGAVAQKKGKFEAANGGTLFLDEVAELPEPTQSMLLRVLQERTFQRLGGTRMIEADIRVIAATNKDLEAAIRTGAFRADLYYRLNVVSLTLPPLRERREDIALLAPFFVRRYSEKNKRRVLAVSPEAILYLQAHDWPGNVRELENAIEYAVVFGSTEQVLPEDLPDNILANTEILGAPQIQYRDAVKDAKKQIVISALRQANNNFGDAARILNIHVNNLHRLIRELNLKSRTGGKTSDPEKD